MESFVALVIIVACLWIIFTQDRVVRPTQSMLVPTDRPNKFISDGDAITVGEVSLDKFTLSFETKVNTENVLIFSLAPIPGSSTTKDETLAFYIRNDTISFNDTIAKLDFSPFSSYSWVYIYVYAEKRWTVVVNSKSFDFGPVKPNRANLVVGGAERVAGFFSGSIANIKVNGDYIYRLVNGGINQDGKKKLSVAGYNDLGIFGNREAYEALKKIDNLSSSQAPKTFPIFNIAPFVHFVLELELRVFKDGLFVVISGTNGKSISIGKNEKKTTETYLDVPLQLEFLDKISIHLTETRVIYTNYTSGQSATQTLKLDPESFKGFNVHTQTTAVCILTRLKQGERQIWNAGENFLEQENQDAVLSKLDFSNCITSIPASVNLRNKWTCNFNLQLKNTDKITFLALVNKSGTFSLSVDGKDVIITIVQDGKSTSYKLSSEIKFSTTVCKFVVKYDSHLSVTFIQNPASMGRFLKFLPNLYSIFSGDHHVLIGGLNETFGYGTGNVYYSNFSLNGVPFKYLEGKTMERQTKKLLGCVIGITFTLDRNLHLFSVKLNKTIGVSIQDGKIYLTIDSKRVYMGSLKKNMTYNLGLKFNKNFTLFVADESGNTSTVKFNPQIYSTNLMTIVFPNAPVEMFKVFGQVASI